MFDFGALQRFLIDNIVGIGLTTGAGFGGYFVLLAARTVGPRIIGSQLRSVFLKARSSGFLTDKTKPKRLELYLAFLEFVEEEVPDRGDPGGQAYFSSLADQLVAHLPSWLPFKAEKLAPVLQAWSDEADDGFDKELKEVRNLSTH